MSMIEKGVVMQLMKYKCDSCGYEFTIFQETDEKTIHYCPRCSKPILWIERLTKDRKIPEHHLDFNEEHRPPLI